MKRKFLILIILTTFTISGYSQDIIFKKDGTTIWANVLEYSKNRIVYKLYNRPETPFQILSAGQVVKVVYDSTEKGTDSIEYAAYLKIWPVQILTEPTQNKYDTITTNTYESLLISSSQPPINNTKAVNDGIPTPKIYADPFSFWVSSNVGLSSFGKDFVFNFLSSFTPPYVINSTAYLEVKSFLFSVGYNKSSESYYPGGWLVFGPSTDNLQNTISYSSARLCAGIVFPGKVFISFSSGISFSTFSNNYQEYNYPTRFVTSYIPIVQSTQNVYCIGVPIEMKMHLCPKNVCGFDIGLTADINHQNSFLGATIGLRIGRIKQHS